MICFRTKDAITILAALEHFRALSHEGRVKCGPGSDVLRGNFVQQEDDAARLAQETREQMP